MRSASAPSGVSRSEGVIRSGSGALRRSLQAVLPTAARAMKDPSSTARARAMPRMFSMCIYEFSESEVDANRVVRRDTERLELLTRRVRGSAAFTSEAVDLGIDAAILRPQMEVAGGEVEGGTARVQIPAGPHVRQRPRRRELAPANERRRLEKAVERLGRIVTRRHDHRLLLERGTRHELAVHHDAVHQAIAVLTADATDPLRVVVPLVAA